MLNKLPQKLSSSQRRALGVAVSLVVMVAGWQLRSAFAPSSPTLPMAVENCESARQLIELNAATAEQLESLPGIGATLSNRIVRFRESLCGFVALDELQQVYGLKPETLASILPMLSLNPADRSRCQRLAHAKGPKASAQMPAAEPSQPGTPASQHGHAPVREAKAVVSVDLNSADSTQLLAVPGIGEKTAGRIVRFRSRLGYFAQVDQLKEVWGVSDENFNRMKSHVTVNPVTGKGIQINTADKEMLGKHPYVGYTNARILVAYHQQHGDFASVEDLREVNGLDWEKLEKALPYLVF